MCFDEFHAILPLLLTLGGHVTFLAWTRGSDVNEGFILHNFIIYTPEEQQVCF